MHTMITRSITGGAPLASDLTRSCSNCKLCARADHFDANQKEGSYVGYTTELLWMSTFPANLLESSSSKSESSRTISYKTARQSAACGALWWVLNLRKLDEKSPTPPLYVMTNDHKK
eukprot:scpid108181/ scgid27273/ 